jgi:hypothetical protein
MVASRNRTTSVDLMRPIESKKPTRSPKQVRGTRAIAVAERELRRVRDDSDDLLEKMNRLKDLEQRKRHMEVSTPEFHDAADEVADVSSEIFRLARDEQTAGDHIDRRQGVSTEDVEPSR